MSDFFAEPPQAKSSSTPKGERALTVGELSRRIKGLLEAEIGTVAVEGEISNLRIPRSGHAYFMLKDEEAAINAVCFRSALARLRAAPADGMQVIARGRVTAYIARGEYQIVVTSMREAGVGELMRRLLELKEKLKREGLFDEDRKRALPRLPRAIGIVTSATGAALRDMLNVLARRARGLDIFVAPCAVQGAAAAGEIIRALDSIERHGRAEAILLARGGGSIEDLWPFNEESVVRAIAACSIPIVSGVGHETDWTLADFAADVRAPTPSAAAEIVTEGYGELAENVAALHGAIDRTMARRIQDRRAELTALAGSWGLRRPIDRLENAMQRLDEMNERIARAACALARPRLARLDAVRHRLELAGPARRLLAARAALDKLALRLRAARPDGRWLPQLARHATLRRQLEARLDTAVRAASAAAAMRLASARDRLGAVGPPSVLRRGYSIITTAGGRKIITAPEQVKLGQALRVQSAGGEWRATPLPPGDELFDRD